MYLASLNTDVLCHLMMFVRPVDRINLVFSGILKGFENVNKGIDIDLQRRIKRIYIELRPCSDRMNQLEIRSLKIRDTDPYEDDRCHEIFKRLAEEGFLKNNWKLDLKMWTLYKNFQKGSPNMLPTQYLGYIFAMKNLHCLISRKFEITLEQLSTLFWSCPELVELDVGLDLSVKSEMDEHRKNELRRGFHKLQFFGFNGHIDNDSWPVILDIMTWLKECVKLELHHNTGTFRNPVCGTNRFSTMNLTLPQNLLCLILNHIPVEFVQLILPYFLHFNTLYLTIYDDIYRERPLRELKELHIAGPDARYLKKILRSCHQIEERNVDFYRDDLQGFTKLELGKLKKLKKLYINSNETSYFEGILRSCRQIEDLEVDCHRANLKDITKLTAENIKKVKLRWTIGPSIEEVLPVLAEWRHLQKLALIIDGRDFPSSDVLCDFIMKMKHLRHLRLFHDSNPQVNSLRDKINEFVLPRRPNFDLCLCTDFFNFP